VADPARANRLRSPPPAYEVGLIRIARSLVAAALIAPALAALPVHALAQTQSFYVPPKIVKQGKATSPIAGSGRVEVKVFVHKSGTVGSVTVVRSTNHADDAAAVEIAKTASYKPGTRDGQPGDDFYTFWLTFNGQTVAVDASGEDSLNRGAANGAMEAINALLGAGKYDEAKTQLQAYLTTHPGDNTAQTLLAASDYYLNDFDDAADAFEQVTTLQPTFVAVAYRSYEAAASDAIKAKKYDQAIAYSTHAIALQPTNPVPYFFRGTAQTYQQSYAPAIADLEKAKSLESGGTTPPETVNTIDIALVQAYFAADQADKGVALAQQVRARDPANAQLIAILSNHYVATGNAAAKAGKAADAVSDYEQAAQLVPGQAAQLYIGAANILGNAAKTPDDFKKALAEVRKALALVPDDAGANYVAGVLAANSGDQPGALAYLQKAKANVGSDAALAAKVDAALKKLGPKQ
jgi:TonB family protein